MLGVVKAPLGAISKMLGVVKAPLGAISKMLGVVKAPLGAISKTCGESCSIALLVDAGLQNNTSTTDQTG